MDIPLSLWRVRLGTAQGLIFAIVGIVLGAASPALGSPPPTAEGSEEDPRCHSRRAPGATVAESIYRLPVYVSVLHTGAHPDDENNALLAYLGRGAFARAAYLSVTRGGGGQNRIGPELFEALGVVRTEELLAGGRGRAVLHPRLRFWVLEERRRDPGEMGPRRDSGGHSPGHSHVSARRGHLSLFGHAIGRPWPPSDGGHPNTRSLCRGR
jgi:hypothetical protein